MSADGSTTSTGPRRLRWSVPRADVSVNDWLDAQVSVSDSMRVLIRESIQRDGYIDVVNRPIGQLPRRGRPPQAGSDSSLEVAGEFGGIAHGEQGATEAPDTGRNRTERSSNEQGGVEPIRVAGPPRQASVDEVMASTRR